MLIEDNIDEILTHAEDYEVVATDFICNGAEQDEMVRKYIDAVNSMYGE